MKNKHKKNLETVKAKRLFHDAIRGERCHRCKETATSMIRTFAVCDSCFAKLRVDNNKLFGKADIPKILKFIKREPDDIEKKLLRRVRKNEKRLR